MKTVKDWKKEVDKVLGEKVSGTIKDFQTQRDQGLLELAELSESLERREGDKERMTKELSSLNLLKDEDKRKHRELSLKLRSVDKAVESLKERSGVLFSKLTFLPTLKLDDNPLLNLLLLVTGKLQ